MDGSAFCHTAARSYSIRSRSILSPMILPHRRVFSVFEEQPMAYSLSPSIKSLNLRKISLLPPWLTFPLLAFLISRILVFGAGMLADTMLPTEPGHWVADPNSHFLSLWAKWDSQYYIDIATDG